MGRMVILCGPSCAGKGPLMAALARLEPGLWARMKKLVLFNSRSPRPGEREGVDYYFRSRAQIEALSKDPGTLVMDVRGDLQALAPRELAAALAAGDALFEGNPFVGRALLESPLVAKTEKIAAFLSPLSREEIQYLQAPERGVSFPDFLADVMRRKLLRRTQRQKGILAQPDLENIEKRARSAYLELKEAWRFERVIVNHDGEDSENWDAFYYPIGDARKSLLAFTDLLQGRTPAGAEKWEAGFPA